MDAAEAPTGSRFRVTPSIVKVLDRLGPLLLTCVGLAVFLNGSFFSTYGSNHVDFSINLTAAHAMRDGADPYGESVLLDRAESLGSPTEFIYQSLFTSYIQPPVSALLVLPLTELSWRDATRVNLILNHVFLFTAVGVTLYTLRPALPRRWLFAGAALILAAYSQVYASFALGQVDAPILLLLSLAFYGYTRGLAPLAGGAIALAAAIKLIPGLLLLYFLWKRECRAFAWGFGVGVALLVTSWAYAGTRTYESYLTGTVPALLKGSTHYSNASAGGLIARVSVDGAVDGVPEILSLGELPSSSFARLARLVLGVAALACLALVIPRRPSAGEQAEPGRLLPEFYLVVAAGLIISSVTWEFYVIWLLPVFLAGFLAAGRMLPGGRWRVIALAALVVAFVALNYPGDCGSSRDCYLFESNEYFYHPDWVPGVLVEREVGIYRDHLDAVLLLRLPALTLVALTLAAIVLSRRPDVSGRVNRLFGPGRHGSKRSQNADVPHEL